MNCVIETYRLIDAAIRPSPFQVDHLVIPYLSRRMLLLVGVDIGTFTAKSSSGACLSTIEYHGVAADVLSPLSDVLSRQTEGTRGRTSDHHQ